MRLPTKDHPQKPSPESQRLITFAQAMVQAASRLEERGWEHNLDLQLQKLLKSNHQESIDNALNHLFENDLNAYDGLMESVEAACESCVVEQEENGVMVKYDVLLIVAPILAWTRFSIAAGPIAADMLATLSTHLSAHLLADNVRLTLAPNLYAIDQLPRSHSETYALMHKLIQSTIKGVPLRPLAKSADVVPFLADTRYLLGVVLASSGAPIFRWQMAQNLANFSAERIAALDQWRAQATPTITRMLPGCGINPMLPEAYCVACRQADKQIRPVSITAAVHYLTQTLSLGPEDFRAIVAGFGEEAADDEIDEYRISFTQRQSPQVIYGVVWPLFGPDDEDDAGIEVPPHIGIASIGGNMPSIKEIMLLLNRSGITHIKRLNERFPAEYCDDCGAPLYADPSGELVHAEMPEDSPRGDEHFH